MQTRREKIEIAALASEIVGAVAVVVSVIYLAIQISESNAELKSQSHVNALMLGQRPIEIELADAELAAIIHLGMQNPDVLSDVDWYRFTQYQVMKINAWEFFYYEHFKGNMTVELWTGADSYYSVIMATSPGVQRFWSENRHVYAAPFNQYVDDVIAAAQSGQE